MRNTAMASHDHHLMHCLDSVHDLLALQRSLSLLLRQGWMDMARARYSMGPSRISHPLFSLKPYSASASLSLALPPDDQADSPLHMALVRLDTGDKISQSASDSDKSGEQQGFEQDLTCAEALPPDWSNDEDTAYRQLLAGVDDSDSESEAAVSNQVKVGEQTRPLRWFGAFVSPHLQASQTSFESALEILVKIANAQGQALHAHNQVMQQRGDVEDGPPAPEAAEML